MRLNKDAIVAWMYVWETVKECPSHEVDRGVDFRRLICDLSKSYEAEFDAFMAVTDAILLLKEETE